MTACLCGHLLTAYLLPDGSCRRCPVADPCDGYIPDEET